MITDAALQAAAKEASLALVETLVQGSSQQPPYIPSKSFARKMSRLCRRERHPVFHRTMQRVAAVFLALLLTGIGWLSVDVLYTVSLGLQRSQKLLTVMSHGFLTDLNQKIYTLMISGSVVFISMKMMSLS